MTSHDQPLFSGQNGTLAEAQLLDAERRAIAIGQKIGAE